VCAAKGKADYSNVLGIDLNVLPKEEKTAYERM
jgi:hypothetical protein